MNFLKSILSEKDGKGSAKRIAGFVATFLFIEIIQVVIWYSIKTGNDIKNQEIILKSLEYTFIIIAVSLVGIAAPTLASILKGRFSVNENDTEK